MPLPKPEPGLVLSYNYLWKRQDDRGEESGEKGRPCVVVLRTETAGGDTVVIVVPVTSRQPAAGRPAIMIPDRVRRHLGLSAAPCWVVLDEVKRFVWAGPDLRQVPGRPGQFHYGFVPPNLFRSIRQGLVKVYEARRLRTTTRTS